MSFLDHVYVTCDLPISANYVKCAWWWSWNTLLLCPSQFCRVSLAWGYRRPALDSRAPSLSLSDPRSLGRSLELSRADWHLFNQRFLVKLKQFRQEHWAVSSGQPTTENWGDTDIFIDKHTLLIKVIPTTNSLSHRYKRTYSWWPF